MDHAAQALYNLEIESRCCITSRGFLKIFKETETKVKRFLQSQEAQGHPGFKKHMAKALDHYQMAAVLHEQYPAKGNLICSGDLYKKILENYPQAGKSFDQGGCMMPDPQGKNCLSPALLVPFLYNEAAREIALLKSQYPPPPPPRGKAARP
jgi:hypothetical protein